MIRFYKVFIISYIFHQPKKKYFNIFMILVVLVMLIYDRSFINIYPLLFKITPISQFIQKYKLKSTFSLESFQVVLHIDTTSHNIEDNCPQNDYVDMCVKVKKKLHYGDLKLSIIPWSQIRIWWIETPVIMVV